MKIIKLLSSDDAVSEVVDFVTILGILTLSIGILGVAGYPIIKNAQEANHIENTRQSFTVLAENINKVVMGQAPSQSVELKMYGDMLSVISASTRTSTINIALIRDAGNVSFEYDLGAIEAKFDTAIIGYENTGTWINYTSGGTIMISKPDFVISNDSMYIPVTTIGISTKGSSSMGGTGLVRVVAEEKWSELNSVSDVKSIRIIVNSSYTGGWQQRFLKETNSWTVLFSGQLIMGQDFNPPVNVYIQRKLIDVSIQS
jgi:hypothetical protein